MTRDEAAELVAKAKLFHLVLAPVGKAFSNLSQSFLETCDVVCSLEEILEVEPLPKRSVVAVVGIEAADHGMSEDRNPLGPLRERVTQMMEDECSVILLSRYPKLRFPIVPGSSLLDDARQYHPGMRSTSESGHRLNALPAWDADSNELDFLTELVGELGTPLVARMDQVLFESVLNPTESLSILSAPERDALWFAGLIQPFEDGFAWSIPLALGDLKDAIANCLAATMEPPGDLSRSYEWLWRIERRIRAALRARAVALWGSGWKESLLNASLRKEAIGRASEVAYPGIKKLNPIRDPLEWLTLGELLALREEKTALGDLGMSSIYWRRLRDELGPIRNQISHMRLTRPGDLMKLKEWDAILARMLDA